MSEWEILGIEETADLRTVKRAYAAKLKKTKPDEDPEGFKALHAAYKWASRYARSSAAHSISSADSAEVTAQHPGRSSAEAPDSLEREVGQGGTAEVAQQVPATSAVEDISVQAATETDEVDFEQGFAFLQAQWGEMSALVDQVTRSEYTINDPGSWSFLSEREALFDLQFKAEISSYIFARIIDCLHVPSGKQQLRRDVFDYLNSLFYWSERRDMLEDEFGFDAVDAILLPQSGTGERAIMWTSPRFHRGNLVYANYYARIFAAIIDLLLLFFVIAFVEGVAKKVFGLDYSFGSHGVVMGMSAVAYLLSSPVLEATPLQGTLGKILFGMKVVNRKGHRLNILHAILRGVLFGISTALFKITVWINFFSNDGRLIHDRLSRSIVIKR